MGKQDDQCGLEITVGDYCYTDRTVTEGDYERFFAISGDGSPIHSDQDYAAKTEFGKRVAPLFLTAAPFSGLVGCGLPGHQALLIRASISARAPIFYGDEIRYSLRVRRKDGRSKLLSLTALGIRGSDIVLSGDILAERRADGASIESVHLPSVTIVKNKEQNVLVLIGGTSAIGQSIASRAARAGYDLVIVYHENRVKALDLKDKLEEHGNSVEVFSHAEFLNELQRPAVSPAWRLRVSGLVTLHSAPINDSYENLYRTVVRDNSNLINTLLPHLLLRQAGILVNVGTGMMIRGGNDHRDYVHAKLALHNHFEQEAIRLGNCGLRWITVAPDQVDTMFSKDVNAGEKLLPEQVAEEVLYVLENCSSKKETFSWVRVSGVKRGRFGGFHPATPAEESSLDSETDVQNITQTNHSTASDKLPARFEIRQRVRRLISNILEVEIGSEVSDEMGVGQILGWDSARHLEIIMKVEQEFGLTLNTSDYAEIETIQDLVTLISQRA